MPKQGPPYFIQEVGGVETYWYGWLNRPEMWRQITREQFYMRVSEWTDTMIAIDRAMDTSGDVG
jgi:hypothetical protein